MSATAALTEFERPEAVAVTTTGPHTNVQTKTASDEIVFIELHTIVATELPWSQVVATETVATTSYVAS